MKPSGGGGPTRPGEPADVVVLGSANQDIVVGVERAPRAGETVLGGELTRHPGGKGLNQAVAAARWGARTAFLGALGDDEAGRGLRAVLEDAGIRTAGTRTVPTATGTALIVVEADGQNRIVVAPGANATLTSLSAGDRAALASARVVLAQLEVPVETVRDGLQTARAGGARTLLNAAPARELAPALLREVDLLVVNEDEARAIAGTGRQPLAAVLTSLLELVPAVVVTLGAAGCRFRSRDGEDVAVAAPRVTVVDTTGAGDTFTGVLAACLAAGEAIRDGLAAAVRAAGVAVGSPGAVSSIPTRGAVDGPGA